MSTVQRPSHSRFAGLLRKLLRHSRAVLAVHALVFLGAQAAQAQDYPTRPVELIVPYAVGGGTDAVARAFGEAANKHFSQPLIMVNRPGAAGAIGHYEGAQAKPDGYKITMVTPEISLALLQGIGKAKYQDFTFIARLNADPIALIVRADAPWKTLDDFLAHVKAHPGLVPVANSGQGATYHLAAIALEEKTGLRFNNIPYVGAGPEIIALLGSQVDAGFATTGEVGTWVKQGKLRLLGVMGDKRLKDFADVPTFRERNIDVELGTWRALAVPKATPPAIVSTLKDVARKVSQDKSYQEFFSKQYLGLVYEDGDKFQPQMEGEFKFYSDIVAKLQLRK